MSVKPGPFLKSGERPCGLARACRTDVSLHEELTGRWPLQAERFSPLPGKDFQARGHGMDFRHGHPGRPASQLKDFSASNR